MKRSDMARTIQVQFKNMRSSDAAAVLNLISEYLIESIANGDKIEIRGFGTFQQRVRAAKMGYNPINGQIAQLAPGKTILFRPSRELTTKMNG